MTGEQQMVKNIGIDVESPKGKAPEQKDRHCPFTGDIKVRGRTFTGTVMSTKMTRTATVSWSRTQYDNKYERYIKKWTKVHAHNPEIINAKKGDIVKIAETRPISKTKNFVIVQVMGTDIEAQIKEENKELDLKTKEAKEEKRRKRKEANAQPAPSDEAEEPSEEAPADEPAQEATVEEEQEEKQADKE